MLEMQRDLDKQAEMLLEIAELRQSLQVSLNPSLSRAPVSSTPV